MRFAKLEDGIPLVANDAARTARFPSPATNQRVQNLTSEKIERYDGAAWVADFTDLDATIPPDGRTVASLATFFANNAVFNVKDWGAIGNDVADDSAAIEAAIADVPAGSRLVFPPGTYKTTREIVVNKPVIIAGYGIGATTIHAATLGADNAALLATVDDVGFCDFTLTGPSSAAFVSEENGIWFYATSGAPKSGGFVERVEVTNFGNAGVLIEHVAGVVVSRSFVHDVGYVGVGNLSGNDFRATSNVVRTITPGTGGNAYGIFVSQRTNEAVVVGFDISGNVVDGVAIWEAIDTHGATDGTIGNNTILNCKIGISVVPSNGTNLAPARTAVTGNVIRKGSVASPDSGIRMGGFSSGVRSVGLSAVGNIIIDMGGTTVTAGALRVQYCNGLVLSGNVLHNSRGSGIDVEGECSNVTFSGNTIAGIQSGIASASGMYLNVTGITGMIAGNYIDASDEHPLRFNFASAGLYFGENAYVTTDADKIIGAQHGGPGLVMRADRTLDVGSIADGDASSFAITVGGALVGDFATVTVSGTLSGLALSAVCQTAGEVQVTLNNNTGGAVDLASTTFYARVVRK